MLKNFLTYLSKLLTLFRGPRSQHRLTSPFRGLGGLFLILLLFIFLPSWAQTTRAGEYSHLSTDEETLWTGPLKFEWSNNKENIKIFSKDFKYEPTTDSNLYVYAYIEGFGYTGYIDLYIGKSTTPISNNGNATVSDLGSNYYVFTFPSSLFDGGLTPTDIKIDGYGCTIYEVTYNADKEKPIGGGGGDDPNNPGGDDPVNPGGDEDDETVEVTAWEGKMEFGEWVDGYYLEIPADYFQKNQPVEGSILKIYTGPVTSNAGIDIYSRDTSIKLFSISSSPEKVDDNTLLYIHNLSKEQIEEFSTYGMKIRIYHRTLYKVTYLANVVPIEESVIISTAQEYLDFIEEYNKPSKSKYKSDVKVFLSSDIDFGGAEVPSLGTADKPFQGTFNGNGHSILGANCSEGLFGIIDGASVTNLIIGESCTFTGTNAAPIAKATGSGNVIENVISNATITGDAAEYAAGFVALDESSDLQIRNCVYAGTISGNNAAAFVATSTSAKIINSFALPSSKVRFSAGSAENCYSSNLSESMTGVTAITDNKRGAFITTESNGKIVPVSSWRFVSLLAPSQNDDERDWQYDINSDFNYPIPFNKINPIAFPDKEAMIISSVEEYKAFVEEFNHDNSIYESDMDVILAKDLTFSASDVLAPLGTSTRPYSGTFSGNGHTISNLNITNTNGDAGMFGVVDGATIKDFTVNGTITGKDYAGLVAQVNNSTNTTTTLSNVVCNVDVNGNHAAGFVANNPTDKLIINDCVYAGTISGDNAAAFVASSNYTQIQNSFAIPEIAVPFYNGHVASTKCTNCYNLELNQEGVAKIYTNDRNVVVAETTDGEYIPVASWRFVRQLTPAGSERVWKYLDDSEYPVPFNHLDPIEDPGDPELIINSVDEYLDFVIEFNSDDSTYELDMKVILGKDLDFSGRKDVLPLGTSDRNFLGTFDGRGHTISGMNIEDKTSEYVGMFGVAGKDASISNLVIDRTSSFSGADNSFVGFVGLVQGAPVTIENILCQASMTGSTASGFVAKNESQNLVINDCVYAEGKIDGQTSLAVFVAENNGSVKINNSFAIPDKEMAFFIGEGEATNCYSNAFSPEISGVVAISRNDSNEYVVQKDGNEIPVASWDFSRMLANGVTSYKRVWKYDENSPYLKDASYKYPIPFNNLQYFEDPANKGGIEWLIVNHSQLSTNSSTNEDSNVDRIGLTDGDSTKDSTLDEGESAIGGDASSPWTSAIKGGDNYIEIDLGFGIGLNDDEDLVAYTKRHTKDNYDHPTGLCIVGGYHNATESDWQEALENQIGESTNAEVVAYAYFLFRGNGGANGTKEYSERLDLSETIRKHFNGTGSDGKRYTKLRVYLIENNTRANDNYSLVNFNIMKLGKNDNYSNILIDRFHLITDYSKKYYDYKFIPTLGIFDQHNQFHSTYYKNMEGYSDFSGNGNPWKKEVENGKDYYKWEKDQDWIGLAGIEIPEYKFLTAKDDSRIINCEKSPYADNENVRQPVHENEHVLYAIPGEPVVLYPFYKINTVKGNDKYAIAYTHWYDYRTGGGSEYLDFLIDPNNAHISEKYGFFGGEYLSEGKANWNYGTVATFFYPRSTSASSKGSIDNIYDTNVSGEDSDKDFIITADLACVFPIEANVIDSDKEIYEPTITFRHIFRIKDGKKFAEEFSGSAENNEKYVSRHRRIISAPCSKKFQIRLDDPVVKENNAANTAAMNTFYKAGKNDYRRVVSCDIEVERINNQGEILETFDYDLFEFSVEFTNESKRSIDGVDYQFYDNGAKYARMLVGINTLNSANRYLVRLVGTDADGNRIKVYGSSKDLVVAEFDITFLPESTTRYKQLDKDYYDSNKKGFTSSLSEEDRDLFEEDENNELNYGKPITIDFDRYRYATWTNDDSEETNGVKTISDYVVGQPDCCYFKWPLAWDLSTYGFPYSIGLSNNNNWGSVEKLPSLDYNYNVYSLVNNILAVTYHKGMGEIGVKDIRYLRTLYQNQKNNPGSSSIEVPTQKDQGFFYWVNAADDPGQAATIRLEELCTGSTIYVTGWLMETSADSHYCNMVFNLVAIREDGTKEVIHSFATGRIENGNWTKIHYEFTPNYSRIQRIMEESAIDHYELELESNSEGSEGADYALDEIRMYIAKPVVEAEQLRPICNEKEVTTTDVRIEMPFEPLLSFLGLREDNSDDSSNSNGSDNSNKSEDITGDDNDNHAENDENAENALKPKHVNPYYSPTQRAADNSHVTIYYTFLDEEVFNKYYHTSGYKAAFEKAQLVYDYDNIGEGKTQTYGTLTFSTNFDSNYEYTNPLPENYYQKAFRRNGDDGVKYLSFITKPEVSKDENGEVEYLTPGRKFIIGIILKENGNSSEKFVPGYRDFDIMNSCSHVTEFTVKSANVITFTNNSVETQESTFCLGSEPEVDVDLKAYSKSGLTVDLKDNGADWYAGSTDEFEKEHIEVNGQPLYLQAALAQFRNKYPDATETKDAVVDADLSSEMIEYITNMTKKKHPDGRNMLVLNPAKYQFKPLTASVSDSINVATAIPIDRVKINEVEDGQEKGITIKYLFEQGYLTIDEDQYSALGERVDETVSICLSLIEVQLKVSPNGPSMFHGFKDITYPSEIASVPIRIGLRQIQATWGSPNTETKDTKERGKTLRIPIKRLSAPTELSAGLKTGHQTDKQEDGTLVYLDPTTEEYYNTNGWLVGEPLYLIDSDDPQFDGSKSYPIVGQVIDMVAAKNRTDNAFYVRFDGLSGLKDNPDGRYYDFREGYYYTLRFNIQEYGRSSSFAQSSCPGQHIFTIKVVPEYVKWNGSLAYSGRVSSLDEEDEGPLGNSKNWNDDGNWLRVSPFDIFPSNNKEDATKAKMLLDDGSKTPVKGTAIRDYNTNAPGATDVTDEGKSNLIDKLTTGLADVDPDASNPNTSGFVPMEFTKVVVDKDVPFPDLYEIKPVKTTDGDWSKLSNIVVTTDPINGNRVVEDTTLHSDKEIAIGDYTHNIHYDMMVTAAKDNKTALTTRPWYANTAKFVHFKPDTQIGGQQHLEYEKVWVDMELNPQSWYTVASPLQSVYAGDMYLPTDGARQVSPLFEGIEFKKKYNLGTGLRDDAKDENHRFRPAVYQRSWNLAHDIVYEIEGEPRDVVRSINWSHVYNDVKVNYAAGEGFSIKTDVTPIETKDKKIDKVLFRFPKEDQTYQYFDYNDVYHDKTDDTPKISETQGRLNATYGEIKIKANKGSKLFLVGNPFMAHLDMQKFLKANESIINSKYWIVNGDRNSAFIIDETKGTMNSNYEGAEIYLPPMAGFFVESINETDELVLTYDESMSILYANSSSNWLSQGSTPLEPGNNEPNIDPNLPLNQDENSGEDEDEGGGESRSGAAGEGGVIRISAGQDGWKHSAAVIRVDDRFASEFVHSEDAELLVDPNITGRSLVYTIGDGNALSINSTPDAYGTEIGVMAADDAITTLLFEGEELDRGYTLYDAKIGKVCDLYDGMRYEVEGAAASRLFLSDAPTVEAVTGLRIESEGREVSVVPADADMEVQVTVCDIAGIVVKDFTTMGATTFRLDGGSYVVTATAADGSTAHAKLLLH